MCKGLNPVRLTFLLCGSGSRVRPRPRRASARLFPRQSYPRCRHATLNERRRRRGRRREISLAAYDFTAYRATLKLLPRGNVKAPFRRAGFLLCKTRHEPPPLFHQPSSSLLRVAVNFWRMPAPRVIFYVGNERAPTTVRRSFHRSRDSRGLRNRRIFVIDFDCSLEVE